MSTKQPSHSGERPVADPAPDSAETPFDPSHFGRHEFPAGLREELIKAEKPRIDPKFLQDTVPPNRKPVLTEPEPVVTTPRGGFAAPKPVPGTIDRDAKTLVAASTTKPAAKASATSHDSPSMPPVDTSRTDATIVLPRVHRPADKRRLVLGIVVAAALLTFVGLLLKYTRSEVPGDVIPSAHPATAASPTEKTEAPSPAPKTSTSDPAARALLKPASPKHQGVAEAEPPHVKPAPASKSRETLKPVSPPPKGRSGFDPSKPWEED
jgi:hypothetical protein